MIKAYDENHKPFLLIDNTNKLNEEKSQKTVKVKISTPKPKGDVEMKNITWRPKEKRYIGRKQINGITYTAYAKTQLACLKKLNKMIKQVKEENNSIVKQRHYYTFEEYWDKWYIENKSLS